LQSEAYQSEQQKKAMEHRPNAHSIAGNPIAGCNACIETTLVSL
jgi:hypothetical protein